MKRMITFIFIILVISCTAVSVYFVINIVGAPDNIIVVYDNLTGRNTENDFGHRYLNVQPSGPNDETLTIQYLGNKSDVSVNGIKGELDPGSPFADEDTPDISKPDARPDVDIEYADISEENGIFYTWQVNPGNGKEWWLHLTDIHGTNMAERGCQIFALWSAAVTRGHISEDTHLEDELLELYGPDGAGYITVGRDGLLCGTIKKNLSFTPNVNVLTDGNYVWYDLAKKWDMTDFEIHTVTQSIPFTDLDPGQIINAWYIHPRVSDHHCVNIHEGTAVQIQSDESFDQLWVAGTIRTSAGNISGAYVSWD